MLARAVCLAIDEPDRLPVVVDRRALVVDEAGIEPDLLHGREIEVGLELRGLLRPGDPEPVRRREELLQAAEAALELTAARGEEDDDLRPGPGAELAAEWGGVDLLRRHSAAIAASRPSTS